MSEFGKERSGNEPTEEEETSARKLLLFSPRKKQTRITSFFKKPQINKRGTITIGHVTNNNTNNED
jgi:hypothetical protein